MGTAVDHFKLDRKVVMLVAAGEFMRLIDWHLGVLIAVDEEQRWVGRIHMRYWTSQLRDFGYLIGLIAEEQLKGGDTHAESVRRGLLQNRA